MDAYADSCDCTSGCNQCYDQALAEAEQELNQSACPGEVNSLGDCVNPHCRECYYID